MCKANGSPLTYKENLGPDTSVYRLLNAVVAQLKNCPFEVNTTIKLKTITTNDNNKQQNTVQVNILKGIPKYKNGDIAVNNFFRSFLKYIVI